MVTERLDNLMRVYGVHLNDAITAHPEQYKFPKEKAPCYVERVSRAIQDSGVDAVNIKTPAWHTTCKTLGIKATLKAITAYLKGE